MLTDGWASSTHAHAVSAPPWEPCEISKKNTFLYSLFMHPMRRNNALLR